PTSPARSRPMTRLSSRVFGRPLVAVRALVGVAAAGAAMVGCSRHGPPSHAAVAAAAPPMTEREVLDLDIDVYKQPAHPDPTGAAGAPAGATDRARGGGLPPRRGREPGARSAALRPEPAARRSVHNRGSRNDAAAQVLSASLLAQHRFDEALSIAETLRDRNPD